MEISYLVLKRQPKQHIKVPNDKLCLRIPDRKAAPPILFLQPGLWQAGSPPHPSLPHSHSPTKAPALWGRVCVGPRVKTKQHLVISWGYKNQDSANTIGAILPGRKNNTKGDDVTAPTQLSTGGPSQTIQTSCLPPCGSNRCLTFSVLENVNRPIYFPFNELVVVMW